MKAYYDNSHVCAECTGMGCRQCNCTGVVRWPLSQAINNACPPAIKQVVSPSKSQILKTAAARFGYTVVEAHVQSIPISNLMGLSLN